MRMEFAGGRARRVAMSGVSMLSLLFVSPQTISSQAPAPPKSPKEVLEAYRKMDAEGERLTSSGWCRASRFFVKPGRPPEHYVLAVIEGERVTGPSQWYKGGNNRARMGVMCSEVGQIDASARFTSMVAPDLIDPSGRLLKQPVTPQATGPTATERVYDLVLTDTHWEFGARGEGPREVKGPPEWRIEIFDFQPWVTIRVAIRYLEQLRDESSSEMIKKNADKSIATLRRLL
jgi:hypothetical protein